VAHGVLLRLPAYSHFGRPHTPLRGLVVLAVSVTPGVVSSRLFSHAFTWARCSRGIRHARRGLFAALLTRLCVGSLFSRYPSRPAWSLRGSSHMPFRGLVVLAVSVTPGVVSSRLFSHAFAWARCSWDIRKKLRNYPCTSVRMTCVGSFASICSSGKDSESYRSNHPLTEARKARKASKATDAPPILPTQPPTLPTQPPTLPTQPPPYGS